MVLIFIAIHIRKPGTLKWT